MAFGMGIDCTGVSKAIHFGPPDNTESYIQDVEEMAVIVKQFFW